jgi:flavin reductase (DIM6/NTAB) family NADH-FMN oxidoreductase RutF
MPVHLLSPDPTHSTTPAASGADSAIDAQTYRAVFRRHAAGVVVITADTGAQPAGFTATSLTSVSLDPPLVSFAIATTASSWPTVAAAVSVVVNFLADDQHALATTFATSGINRFAAPTRWSRLVTGEPVLDDAGSHLRAEIVERLPVGDHHVVVAQVTHAWTRRERGPLVYCGGAYAGVRPIGS